MQANTSLRADVSYFLCTQASQHLCLLFPCFLSLFCSSSLSLNSKHVEINEINVYKIDSRIHKMSVHKISVGSAEVYILP